jgi:hypothetical protein
MAKCISVEYADMHFVHGFFDWSFRSVLKEYLHWYSNRGIAENVFSIVYCRSIMEMHSCSYTTMTVSLWIITVNPTVVTHNDPRCKSWVLVSLP